MKRPHLYLTGYRGCGKSTVAKLLAAQLNLPWTDLDDVIESTAGTSIAKIFAEEGEPGFRHRETLALQSVAQHRPSVIALGGGAILSPVNRTAIATTGWCVWLDADPAVIAERLATDHTTGTRRPALTGLTPTEEIIAVMNQREPLYREVADVRIDTTLQAIPQIVQEIETAFVRRRAEE
tara:strand:+ start:1637 stop:2176 length:540 start_codon:yes stop_codon:yes gene_type:complete